MKTLERKKNNELTLIKDCASCMYKSLLFDTLDSNTLGKINAQRKQRDYKKGERICIEGERIEDLVYIHTGLVKLSTRNNDGETQILSIAQPLDYVGLLSVFSNSTYQYSITAIETTSVCFVNLESIKNTIKNNGDFALELIEKMSKASDEILLYRQMLSKKGLKEKIGFILLFFSKEIYKSNVFELPISRQELADLIGSSAEGVIRIISDLKRQKIINSRGQKIEILDIERLTKHI